MLIRHARPGRFVVEVNNSPERRIAALAGRQHNVVQAAQLRAIGIDAEAIKYRLRVGRLHRLHRAVYAVGGPELTREGRFLGAVLAVGDDTVSGFRASGALWGFMDHHEPEVLTTRRLRQRPGMRIHFTTHLPRSDTSRRFNIPVTSPVRTILDLATVLDTRSLRRVVHQAEVERRASHAALAAEWHRAPPRLREVLYLGEAPTRSELEDRTLELIREAGLPTPLPNHFLDDLGFEVDFLWKEHRLVLEADGARFHGPLRAAEDRRRQALLEAAGYRVLRVTWDDVTRRGAEVVARLRHALWQACA